MFASVQFDYWEVRPNELLHHHGMLSDLKRYSSPDLRVDKEINDVFEYMLLRSGRLTLHPSGEKRAITLENVLFITQKEEALTRMEKGTYGICRDCGDTTATARLEAIPWTRVCITCKQKQNA